MNTALWTSEKWFYLYNTAKENEPNRFYCSTSGNLNHRLDLTCLGSFKNFDELKLLLSVFIEDERQILHIASDLIQTWCSEN